ncbi:restriction endonuclease subunit S [Aureimonas sp. ME7]|uniref:restriction endonuclease subunit S n=1 Tax=Aureimonas sp. ME7 TaxID=2744252 RepID=UPI0015F5660E|nr:restriction endonuclease subunit S [Aureimonas sp. ME7]
MSTGLSVGFEELVADVSAGNNKIQRTNYLLTGAHPIVDQGHELIGGYSNSSEDLVCGGGPWVVFGDHTRSVKYLDQPFCMGADGVKVLRPRSLERLDPKYLYHFLVAHPVPSAGYSRHFKFLKKLAIPLPPIAEQRRIAAILDKADALRRKRKRALELLDSFLVARFIELFGHPGENSRNLATVSLGQLGKWQSGGTPPRSQVAYFGGGIKWFSSGDLGKKFSENSSETITKEALINTSAKLVPSGALMLGMYDTAALKSTIATEDCSCNQAVAFASINQDIAITEYVYHAIQIGKEHFRKKQRGVRQKNLNLDLVREIEIPFPPMSDQALFLSTIKTIEVANSGAAASLMQQDQLFASLQHRAFSGQL